MKRKMPAIIMCLLPLVAVAYLFYSLETYYSVTHNECGINICIYCAAAFVASFIIWLKTKATRKYMTWIFIISTLILAGVFYVGYRIPYCVVCQGITADKLGFLTHWIVPVP